MKRCNLIADSLVSGEPLSDGDRAHLATCADCERLAAMPRMIAATAAAPEPGPGFASRITAGARERLASRRRQRVFAFGLATAAAAGAAVLVVHGSGDHVRKVSNAPQAGLHGSASPPADGEITDDELGALVHDSSLRSAMAPSADWASIDAPLRNYRIVLVRGGKP